MVHKHKHQKLIFAYTHKQTNKQTNKNPQPNFHLQMHKSKAYGRYTHNMKASKPYVIELQVLICLYVLAIASRASVT